MGAWGHLSGLMGAWLILSLATLLMGACLGLTLGHGSVAKAHFELMGVWQILSLAILLMEACLGLTLSHGRMAKAHFELMGAWQSLSLFALLMGAHLGLSLYSSCSRDRDKGMSC